MTKHTLKEWMIAVRPWSIPASAMPIIVTIAFLFWKEADIKWGYAIWALVGMILFHLAGNVWSDWFDFRKKVDAEDTFGAKTLTTGMFEPKEIRNLAIGLLAVSVACGLGLAAVTGIELLYIGIAGAVLTVLYPSSSTMPSETLTSFSHSLFSLPWAQHSQQQALSTGTCL